MMKRILYIFIAAALLSSCGSDNPGPGPDNEELQTFLSKSIEGAYVNGSAAIALDDATHQVAKNPTALTYRIQNDSQSQFFHAKLSSKPTAEQQKVTVMLNVRGVTGLSSSYEMTLEKSSADKLWLWHDASSTGIIVAL